MQRWIIFALAAVVGVATPQGFRSLLLGELAYSLVLAGYLLPRVRRTRREPWRTPERIPTWVLALTVGLLVLDLAIWLLYEQVLFLPWLVQAGSWMMLGGALLTVDAMHTLGGSWSLLSTPHQESVFRRDGPYRLVRHPMYLGLLMLVVGLLSAWMGVIGLVTSLVAGIADVLVAVQREERNLIGDPRFVDYPQYQQEVPRFVPSLKSTLAYLRTRVTL